LQRTLLVALNELRLMLSDRSIWVNIVIVPLIAAFAAGWANSSLSGSDDASATPLVDVVDFANDANSQSFQRQILAVQPRMQLCPPLQPEDDPADRCGLRDAEFSYDMALQRLKDEQVAAALIIEADFSERLQASKPITFTLYASNANLDVDKITRGLQSAAARFGTLHLALEWNERLSADIQLDQESKDELEQQVVARNQELWQDPPVQIAKQSSEQRLNTGALPGYSQSIPGMGSMYVLFCVLPLSQSFIRDRKQWTLQRLSSMPLRTSQIMGGKLMAYGAIGLLQLVIVFGFGMLLGLRFGDDLLALLLVVLSFVAAITALALLMSTLVSTEQQASSLNLLLTLLLAPLGGAWWPLDIVPEWMRIVGHISPIAWAMDAYKAMIFRNAGLAGVWLPILVLSVMAIIFFAISVLRIRRS
jgi:ABC-2 type transport system permease protein